MKAKAECPLCNGRGVILEQDPCAPARLCGCSMGIQGEAVRGVPPRYAKASMDGFLKWWKRRFTDESVLAELDEARALMENDLSRASVRPELQNRIVGILDKCRGKNESGGAGRASAPRRSRTASARSGCGYRMTTPASPSSG
jgi:hypothetical protein